MAFVAISTLKKFDVVSKDPRVTIRTDGISYITKTIYEGESPSTIDVQIDLKLKKIRLRTGNSFSQKLYGPTTCCFLVPRAVSSAIVPHGEKGLKISLTKSNDGWWYGQY
ncbi:hypothetical protein MCH33_003733 [Salmonella enterica subsp. enterica serovar Agbeni]|nr:hypothetical protein [Salmonella enterica subsp. enterica serovar Agbeni]EBF8123605.1 hypothetical protein [Salmonella enterica subsp. enterica serovar Aba]EGL2188227.1 hypothetical protein [Salmonella enterica subsp. enterica serovar Agbeni]EHW4299225.1 hypothetical protein [Salmonella enterica subsp. enterica serovar Agbeni]EHW9667071.1 hypothetical protein [Salmonella enterica subsp. enterica serovar Agbeni]